MTAPMQIRLSPSGPFIADSDSDQPLQGGDGTPGLVWRAQGTLVTATACDPGGVALAGLNPAWLIPAGYKYDVRCDIQLVVAGNTDQVDVHVQYSEDGGLTYLPAMPGSVCRTISRVTSAVNSLFYSHQEVRWDRTAVGTALITNMNVWIVGPATSSYSPAGCTLRVWQYVD